MSSKETIDLTSNETRVEVEKNGKFDTFEKLYNVKIEKYQKKKQGDYLPWSLAWGLFKHYRPDASYIFEPDRHFESGEVEVVCSVTSAGHTIQMILPVLQNNNKPAINPNRHQVNTARMRCLTKAIAMHGLGLTCWNWVAIQDIEDFGSNEKVEEDSPAAPKLEIKAEPEPPKAPEQKTINAMAKKIAAGDPIAGMIQILNSRGLVATPEQMKILEDAVPETGEAA
jgi:hypothetical protein